MTSKHLRYSISSPNCRARRLITPKRIGQMMKPSCSSGPSKNTAEAKELLHKGLTRMTGCRSLDSSLGEMTLSVNTNSTRIRSLRYRKAIGSREKMKSLSGSSEKMEQSNGVKLPTNWIRISPSIETVSNAERDGLTFWILKSRKTHSALQKIFSSLKRGLVLETNGPKSSKKCLEELKTMWRIDLTWCSKISKMNSSRIEPISRSLSCKKSATKIKRRLRTKSMKKSSSEGWSKRKQKNLKKRSSYPLKKIPRMTSVVISQWILATDFLQIAQWLKNSATRSQTQTWMRHQEEAWQIQLHSTMPTQVTRINRIRMLKRLNGPTKRNSWKWAIPAKTKSRSTTLLRDWSSRVQVKSMWSSDLSSTSRRTSIGWSGYRLPMPVTRRWARRTTWWAHLVTAWGSWIETRAQTRIPWNIWATTPSHQVVNLAVLGSLELDSPITNRSKSSLVQTASRRMSRLWRLQIHNNHLNKMFTILSLGRRMRWHQRLLLELDKTSHPWVPARNCSDFQMVKSSEPLLASHHNRMEGHSRPTPWTELEHWTIKHPPTANSLLTGRCRRSDLRSLAKSSSLKWIRKSSWSSVPLAYLPAGKVKIDTYSFNRQSKYCFRHLCSCWGRMSPRMALTTRGRGTMTKRLR